ncbi:Eaa protein [Salmonella enterica subsp. enterica serovar Muenster]|nr:Eaa protein [Salmonella enterica subsp. enterica serovar Muenster]
MTTITREQQKQILIDTANHVISRDNTSPYSENLRELARIALAALTAEPVRYLNKFSGTCVTLEQQSNAADDVAVYIPLYAAPPAPVVPDEMATSDDMNLYQKSFAQGYNACRNAMLNGGKS